MRKTILLIVINIQLSMNLWAAIPRFYVENFYQERQDVNNQYWDVIIDKRGIIYTANSKGVYEFDGSSWRLITLPDFAESYSLEINNNGRVYVGGKGEIGYLVPNLRGDIKYVSLKDLLPSSFRKYQGIIVNIEFFDNKIAFISDNFVFIHSENSNKTIEVIKAPGFIYSSAVAGNKMYIIDKQYGLMKLDHSQFKPIPNGDGIISYVMMPYQKDKIMIVSPNKGFVQFNTVNLSISYLSTSNTRFKYDIKSGIALNDGNFAFGSIQNGCIITDSVGNELYKINSEHGLLDNSVYNIKQDDNGDLWLGLAKGLAIIYDRNEQKPKSIESGSEFRTYIRSFKNRKNNNILFAGNYLNPDDSIQSLEQNKIQILDFHYSINGFRFIFSSNHFQNKSNVKYQYYLEGLEQNWCVWTNENACEYTNLDWGKYTFHVRAKNICEEISNEASYTFIINKPWYQNFWFYAAQIGVLILLLVWSAFLYKTGRYIKMAGYISSIVVVIVFNYLEIVAEPIFTLVATGIAFFDVLTNVLLGLAIDPAQESTYSLFEKYVVKKNKNDDSIENNQ